MAALKICSVLLMFVSFAVDGTGQTGVPAGQETPPPCRPVPRLAADAEQIANQIGVMPQVQRLRELSTACDRSSAAVTVEELVLRQRITEAVIAAALDVDSVVAEIEYERAQILGTRDLLSSARDRKINLLSFANIVAGTGAGILKRRCSAANPSCAVCIRKTSGHS